MNKLLTISLIIFFAIKGCDKINIQPSEVSFISERISDSTFYHIVNNSVAPVEIRLKKLDKSIAAITLKNEVTLQNRDTIFKAVSVTNLFINSIDESELLSKYISSKFDYGDSKTARHNDNYSYSLPIEIGKEVRISQGFNGKKSHQSIASKYAIDFDIQVGTKIYAAREGVVVYTITHYKKSGGKELTYKANKIVILHNDGTFASYSHLKHNGAIIKKGDNVKRGQHIGYSGNTGNSSGPHLHFAVRLPRDICVPIYFEGYEGKVFKKGQYLIRKE
jgi:murein DD-endopeptidase MepM/ murein hydrolase activator NlpD